MQYKNKGNATIIFDRNTIYKINEIHYKNTELIFFCYACRHTILKYKIEILCFHRDS